MSDDENDTYFGVGITMWLLAGSGFFALCYSASDVAMVLFAGVAVCLGIRYIMRRGVQTP